ncbi:hypothetical protein CCACVL1_22675, partial [Corchorus capsularis]
GCVGTWDAIKGRLWSQLAALMARILPLV